jgi:hypothetical protein
VEHFIVADQSAAVGGCSILQCLLPKLAFVDLQWQPIRTVSLVEAFRAEDLMLKFLCIEASMLKIFQRSMARSSDDRRPAAGP